MISMKREEVLGSSTSSAIAVNRTSSRRLFSRMSSQKDRSRLLDEKFQEAMKRADVDKDKPYRNPLDLD